MQSDPIPKAVLIEAVNATLVDAEYKGYSVDKWGEAEAAHCRKLCGESYATVETDWIRQAAINLRKGGKLVAVNNGAKRKEWQEPSGEYAGYLRSDHWKVFRLTVLEFWGHRCCLCDSDKRIEVHHNTYQRLGAERLTDCVALCHTCHMKNHGRMPDGNEILNVTGELF